MLAGANVVARIMGKLGCDVVEARRDGERATAGEAFFRVRGTAGTNRMGEQFGPSDRPVPLPLYDGEIEPSRWSASKHNADNAYPLEATSIHAN